MQEQVQPKSELKDDEEEFWQPTNRQLNNTASLVMAMQQQDETDGFVTKRV